MRKFIPFIVVFVVLASNVAPVDAADASPPPTTAVANAGPAAPVATSAAPLPPSLPLLTLTTEDAQNWPQIPNALDQCVSSLLLRNDAAICRSLSTYLTTFAGRVVLAAKQAEAKDAPAPSK